MDEELMRRLELKVDLLLAALKKFEPLLDRLLAGGSLLHPLAGRRPANNPFRGGKDGNRSEGSAG